MLALQLLVAPSPDLTSCRLFASDKVSTIPAEAGCRLITKRVLNNYNTMQVCKCEATKHIILLQVHNNAALGAYLECHPVHQVRHGWLKHLSSCLA